MFINRERDPRNVTATTYRVLILPFFVVVRTFLLYSVLNAQKRVAKPRSGRALAWTRVGDRAGVGLGRRLFVCVFVCAVVA